MNQLAIDFTQGRQLRDTGMQQAVSHAERIDDEWPDRAYAFLREFARRNAQFISENLTGEAISLGYGSPADARAWGAIFSKAARAGVIERIGYGVSVRRHCSPTPLWRSLVFVGSAA